MPASGSAFAQTRTAGALCEGWRGPLLAPAGYSLVPGQPPVLPCATPVLEPVSTASSRPFKPLVCSSSP